MKNMLIVLATIAVCSCSYAEAETFSKEECAIASTAPNVILPQSYFDLLEQAFNEIRNGKHEKITSREEAGSQGLYEIWEYAGESYYAEYALVGSGEYIVLGCMKPTKTVVHAYSEVLNRQGVRGEWEFTFSNPEETSLITLQGSAGEFILVTYRSSYLD